MADEEHARKYGKYIKGQGEDDKRGIGHKDPSSYIEGIRDGAVGTRGGNAEEDVPTYSKDGHKFRFVPAKTKEGK
ncbi:hypothetical protein FPSE_10668 [Fusarium pseudograminearum CS3096]|uniref:Uncharacterized protein n=1 Tax=Fusarium pseudograminearum (strain CS3096) TaxID=1028729 RepID=K3V7H5_FUSPC|nr:hypothetical protein FPSE_10668 [Fusarium pseudograminearum CS3096]EKJ69144.1 hypothetical protein FPSE_10668 [Fusarium pseudograminearum CS3096]